MKRLIALVFALCLMVPAVAGPVERLESIAEKMARLEQEIRALELELFGPQYGNGDPRCSIYFDDNECLPGERFCSYWAYQEPYGCRCVLWWVC